MRQSAATMLAFILHRAGRSLPLLFFTATLVLCAFAVPGAEADWKRVRALEFNGGAIVDFHPASSDAALVLAAMPEGFSIYSLDFVSGGIRKVVSQIYLQGLVPDSSDAEDLRMWFDGESGLLLLAPRAGDTPPVLLDISSAPYLKRHKLGIKEGYRISAATFGNGALYFTPSLDSALGSAPGILNFLPKEERIVQIIPNRKFAVIDELAFAHTNNKLLLLGSFNISTLGSSSSLAWLDLDGGLSLIGGSESALALSCGPNHFSWIHKESGRAKAGDDRSEGYNMTIAPLEGQDMRKTLMLHGIPTWYAITKDGSVALVVSSDGEVLGDLWAVDIASRKRTRLRSEVLAVKVAPDGDACFVLPAAKNQLELYAP